MCYRECHLILSPQRNLAIEQAGVRVAERKTALGFVGGSFPSVCDTFAQRVKVCPVGEDCKLHKRIGAADHFREQKALAADPNNPEYMRWSRLFGQFSPIFK
jgi:hypothetical protein